MLISERLVDLQLIFHSEGGQTALVLCQFFEKSFVTGTVTSQLSV